MDPHYIKLQLHDHLSRIVNGELPELKPFQFYIVLFGSVARGSSRCDDSDIDLAIRPVTSHYDPLDVFIIQRRLQKSISPRISIIVLNEVSANDKALSILRDAIPVFFTDILAVRKYYEDLRKVPYSLFPSKEIVTTTVQDKLKLREEAHTALSYAKEVFDIISHAISTHGMYVKRQSEVYHDLLRSVGLVSLFERLVKYLAKVVYVVAKAHGFNVKTYEEAWKALIENNIIDKKYTKILMALPAMSSTITYANPLYIFTINNTLKAIALHLHILEALMTELTRLVLAIRV